ncbi:hypothetical protein ABH966_003682 [Lysinibacillus sp. RC46]|uniref:hypothetical protein n=1 Tax=Lysinibacillus sp. RC46 TaxID=3156295 RepID=UPI00351482F4
MTGLSVTSALLSVALISYRRSSSAIHRFDWSFRHSGSTFRLSDSSFRLSGSSFCRSSYPNKTKKGHEFNITIDSCP